MSNNISIEVRRFRIDKEICSSWDRILDQNHTRTPFCEKEWFFSWFEAMKDERKFFLCTARNSDGIVGIIPFAFRTAPWHDLFMTIQEIGYGPTADYQIPLIVNGMEEDLLPKMLSKILNFGNPMKISEILNLPVKNSNYLLIDKLLKKHQYFVKKQITCCPMIRFDETLEETFGSWRKKHRYNIKKNLKELTSLGTLSLRVINDKDNINKHLKKFINVYRSKWKLQGQKNTIFDDPNMIIFYQKLLQAIRKRDLHFSLLFCGDNVISYHIGFTNNKWLYYYKPTYVPDYSKYSPGIIHILKLIEHGHANGFVGMDFLQGSESYKYRWTNEIIKTARYHISLSKMNFYFIWKSSLKEKLRKLFRNSYYEK